MIFQGNEINMTTLDVAAIGEKRLFNNRKLVFIPSQEVAW